MKKEEYEALILQLYRLVISAEYTSRTKQFKGFKEAQKLIIDNIIKIESTITAQKIISKNKRVGSLSAFEQQISILKEFGNSMAWIIIGENETDLRAYSGAGSDSGHLKDKNISSSLKAIDYAANISDAIILLTDITTVINTGDLLISKVGKFPIVLEMKEGKVNKDLIAIADDPKAQAEYVEQMPEAKRKGVERQIKRLRDQNQRLEHLNDYMKDGSKRFDENLNMHVSIFEPEKPLKSKYYTNQIQNAYDKLTDDNIKTIFVTGGVSVLIAKRAYSDDEVIYFQHSMYHKSNHHTKQECMINNPSFTRSQINAEIKGMQEMELFIGIQGIAQGGYKPTLVTLSKFSDELAINLLLGKSMLYFYVDTGEFLQKIQKDGLTWELKKRSDKIPSKGLLVYKNKNVLVDGTALMTTNFIHKMVRTFTKPTYELEILKLSVGEAKRQIKLISKNHPDTD